MMSTCYAHYLSAPTKHSCSVSPRMRPMARPPSALSRMNSGTPPVNTHVPHVPPTSSLYSKTVTLLYSAQRHPDRLACGRPSSCVARSPSPISAGSDPSTPLALRPRPPAPPSFSPDRSPSLRTSRSHTTYPATSSARLSFQNGRSGYRKEDLSSWEEQRNKASEQQEGWRSKCSTGQRSSFRCVPTVRPLGSGGRGTDSPFSCAHSLA